MSYSWYRLWRIATSQAGLERGNFFARRLPPPSQPVYLDYSVKVPQSQGGLTRQGYSNLTLLWETMDGLQLETLRTLVEAGITAGALYVTLDRADGGNVQNDFVDCHGVPHPLEFQAVQNAQGMVFQNVTLRINALTIDTNPSSAV